MTLVVCRIAGEKVEAFADSRISSGERTATDVGPKIFLVPVQVKSIDNSSDALSHSFGFAFAGSTLLAANCHSLASTVTQLLFHDNKPSLPPMAEVAKLYAEVGTHIIRDYNSRINGPHHQFFRGILFGYCPRTSMPKAFLIHLDRSAGQAVMVATEHDFSAEPTLAIGSGAAAFRASQKSRFGTGASAAMSAFLHVIDTGALKDVGGFAQIAAAGRDGVNFSPILSPSEQGDELVSVAILGFELADKAHFTDLMIGREAIGIGMNKSMSDSALKALGLDPGDSAISQEVRNRAALEASMEIQAATGGTVPVNDSFELPQLLPVYGQFYVTVKCEHCGATNPLLHDRSNGGGHSTLVGYGYLCSDCKSCGLHMYAELGRTFSVQWSAILA